MSLTPKQKAQKNEYVNKEPTKTGPKYCTRCKVKVANMIVHIRAHHKEEWEYYMQSRVYHWKF